MAGPTRIADHPRFQIRDCHPLWFRIPSDSSGFRDQRAVPVSLAATQGIAVAFFSSGYLDVSVLRVRPAYLCIQYTVIQESWDQRSFDNSPRLIAAFHALHRLLTPRHPPYALTCLTTKIHGHHTQRPASLHCQNTNCRTENHSPNMVTIFAIRCSSNSHLFTRQQDVGKIKNDSFSLRENAILDAT